MPLWRVEVWRIRKMGKLVPLIVAFLLVGTVYAADHKADEAAIRGQFDQFVAAWQKDDAKALADMSTEDADLINPFGRVAIGRAEIQKLFEDEHSKFLKGTTWSYTNLRVQFVTDDVAVATVDAQIAGAKGADGTPIEIPAHMLTCVLRKTADGWRSVATRVMMPAKPPQPPPAK
jgi:uncharacterized protein (TIGR02246 family)